MSESADHSPNSRAAIIWLTLIGALLLPIQATFAEETACQRAPEDRPILAAPVDARTDSLPIPFRTAPSALEPQELLAVSQSKAAEALEGLGAPRCYTELLPAIAARTAFLSPFEYLVVGYYDRDATTRDALLKLYRDDPQEAVRRVASVWPSPRAEMVVRTLAFFDLDTDQIYVNATALEADIAANVLIHEFWHALADVRLARTSEGAVTRTTGFWSEIRPPGSHGWRPVDEEIEPGVPTYLMNEALAIEMEVSATGRQHATMRPDIVQASEALQELFERSGRGRVIRLYLESRSEELKALARQTN